MVCALAGAVQAQDGADFVFDTWQTDAGLPHNSVTALLQTRDRYLWIGTSNGLARFDGVRFTTFPAVDNPGLRGNRILCLHEVSTGVLWIGTGDGGLANYRAGQFTSFTTENGLSSDTVLCLGEDKEGVLWAGTASGLNQWSGGRFVTFFQTDGLPDDRVSALCQPRQSALLVATAKGLCRFSREGLAAYEAMAPTQVGIRCLHEDRQGRLWLGNDEGLFSLQTAGKGGVALISKFHSGQVLSLVERMDGTLWFGTGAGALCRVLPTEGTSKKVWHFPSPVTALCEDCEGNLWVGTAANGLHRLKSRQLRLIPKTEVLSESATPCFFESPTGELRFLSGDNRLYGCKGGYLTLLERWPLPDGVAVRTVCETTAGQFWIGTIGDGLFEYKNGLLRQFSERDGLSDSAIESLYPEENGGLWVGTRNGGLNYFKDHTVTRFNTPWGFWSRYACVLEKDRAGNLWVGTTGDGLFQLAQGRFVAYTETNGLPSPWLELIREKQFVAYAETNGLPSGYIRALYADPDGSLWVGTAKGLCRIRDGRVTAFNGRNGLVEEAILQLRRDDGNLWVGSSSGIFRLRTDQLNAWSEERTHFIDPVPFGGEDGLPGAQCLTEFPSQTGRGKPGDEIWLSTTKGLVSIRRGDFKQNTLLPAVTLEEVLVDDQRVPFNGSLRVAPGKQSLEFRYTALSLTAPGKVLFRYQLEGLDSDWSELRASRTARYPKVPPGKYRFQVVARNNDGIWNEQGAGIDIVVAPFWWATEWFRFGLAAAFAGLLGGLYRMRQTRRRELERLRVRIAGDLHDDIGSNLWSIMLLSRILAKQGNLDDENRQDVNEINRIAAQTSNSIRDIIWLINPAFDTMQDLMLRTRDFAGTALRGVNYRLHCQDALLPVKLPLEFRQNIFLVFKETLTNIARHARATEVEAGIEESDGMWRIVIHDNGRGFDPATVTGGNGLKNLRTRAMKMGAGLELTSRPGQGATLVFTVPRP
jgi:ligand-binding sensor domain-containing protein/signal transduction histidine kinase